MSRRSIYPRRGLLVVVVVLLCTAPLASVAGAADVPADGATPAAPAGPASLADPGGSPVAAGDARLDPALADADGVVEGIVRFADDGGGADRSTLQARANRSQEPLERTAASTDGLTVERGFWLTNAALITVDTDRVDLETVATIDGVVEIHGNPVVELPTGSANTAATGVDGHYTYGLEQLRAPAAWEAGARGDGATIVVLDTGADASHPDVQVDEWRDFSGNAQEPVDYDGHGTHVAGTAVGGDASGTAIGVAPDARLVAGAVLTECDTDGCAGSTSDVIAGMEWALEHDADVISMSLGSEGYAPAYLDAVRTAEAAGAVVVAGSGNDGHGTSVSPGNVYDAIAVGATDEWRRVADFSSGEIVDTRSAWGSDAPADWPDSYVVPTVVAPGDRILSAAPGGGYERKRGTSMATPHVAGTVALLQGHTERTLTPDEIETALTETATDADDGPDARYGHGIVDAAAALEHVDETASIEGVVTDAVTGEPIAGATVTATIPDGTPVEATTDDEGQYVLEGLEADRAYTVTATADGYEATTTTALAPAGEPATVDLELAGDARLEVTVADATFGDGIGDATVTAASRNGTYEASADGTGTYVVADLPSGSGYALAVTADGYVGASTDVTVSTSGTTVADPIELVGDGELAIDVADAVTDAPIVNASVTVERPDGASTPVSTDADGAVTTPVQGESTYAVHADAPGYDGDGAEPTVPSDETVPVGLSLAGDGTLSLELVDGTFGEPVTGASVTAVGPQGEYPGVHETDGAYVVPDVPSRGAYDVTATAPGYVPATVELGWHPAGTTADSLALEGNATLSVDVVDGDGEPIADANVTVEHPDGTAVTTESGADGSVRLPVPGIGDEYAISVDAVGYESAATSLVVSSEATERVTVTLLETDDGVPGFGGTAAAVALVLGVLVAVGLRTTS